MVAQAISLKPSTAAESVIDKASQTRFKKAKNGLKGENLVFKNLDKDCGYREVIHASCGDSRLGYDIKTCLLYTSPSPRD